MAIDEAQDLKTFKLGDVVRKLLIYEIHLPKKTEKQIPQQGLLLKSGDIEVQ